MRDAIVWAFAAGFVTGTASTIAFVVVTIKRVQRGKATAPDDRGFIGPDRDWEGSGF